MLKIYTDSSKSNKRFIRDVVAKFDMSLIDPKRHMMMKNLSMHSRKLRE